MSGSAKHRRSPAATAANLGEHLLAGLDHLGQPVVRRSISRFARSVGIVGATLAVIFAGLAVTVAAVAGIAQGVSTASGHLAASTRPLTGGPPVTESMEILTGKMDGRSGWPRYTNASWSVHAGQSVTIKITSYDDGTAPPMGSQAMYNTVEGTVGGTETVDGRTIRGMPTEDVAHTFTIVALRLNLPIPAAPTGGSVTVVARFVPKVTGVFMWQCYAPCGSGKNAMGGAMSTMGWMEGKVTVSA